MKKIALMLTVVLSMTLTSCSLFESKKIEPQVIGTGILLYNSQYDLWFVPIDATSYYDISAIKNPASSAHIFKPEEIRPTQEMAGHIVTIFTAKKKKGLHAVLGDQSAEQIEALYHHNDTGAVIGFICLMLVCMAIIAAKNKER